MKLPDFSFEKPLWQDDFVVIGVDEVGRGSWVGPVVAVACAFFARGPVGLHPYPTSSIAGAPCGRSMGVPRARHPSQILFTTPTSEKEILNLGINDSKALKSREREQLAELIKERSLWAIGEVGVSVINRVGIGKATQMAMRKAINSIMYQVESSKYKNTHNTSYKLHTTNFFVLVDGFHIRYLQGVGLKNQRGIVKGDQKSISIAAASILAKVYRDNLMRKLAEKLPLYSWGQNKQNLFRAKGRDIYGWARNKGYGTKLHQKVILRYGLTRLHRKKFVETFLNKLERTK